MTPYEIVDLRATLITRYFAQIRYWLTVTFAVFASSFYVKSQIDWRISLALVIFYIANCLIIFGSMKSTGKQMSALVYDAHKFIDLNPDAPQIVHAVVPISPFALYISYALMPIGIVSLILFIFDM
jgi:hypothetical protein